MIIRSIDDVLPHVDGRNDFIVADKGDYIVIDYLYVTDDTFDHPARVECRGIKFRKDGSLLSRPFAKFWNINERPGCMASDLDFTKPHTIMEKLDGSMIHPALIDGQVCFMTRMGRTEHAIRSERHLTADLCRECDKHARFGWTPIFEWTAPDNRIVVRYEDSRLTLLALRHNETGRYIPHSELKYHAYNMGVPFVASPSSAYTTAADFLSYARAITGKEGFVVRWEDGTMVKAKGEDYVLKHRAKDSILQEKNLLALVLSGGLDDVLPLLDEADAEACREYRDAVEFGIARQADALWCIIADNDNGDRKQFATTVVPRLAPHLRPLAFKIYDGGKPHDVIRERIAANCNSQAGVDECRPLHGVVWAA